MSTLAEVFALMVSLMDAPVEAAFEGRSRLEQVDDAGQTVTYFHVETALGVVSVNVGADEGRVVFLNAVGEADPVVQTGVPTARWRDAEAFARDWIADQARGPGAAASFEHLELYVLDDPAAPLRISFGPSFPPGPWTQETRALHILSYRVSPELAAERTGL